jgi:CheY-like chemotaxis protein
VPVAPSSANIPAQPGLSERICGPSRILLAEDNPVNQLLAVKLLDKHGHKVSLASNRKDAVDAVASGAQFDLVLMDLQMSEVSG